MALRKITRLVSPVTIGNILDIDVGSNGAILLSLTLTWQPLVYFNANTENEVIAPGDIHVLVVDSLTTRSLLGQLRFAPQPDVVVVPTNWFWSWEHPDINYLAAANVYNKLAVNTAFASQPDGVIVPGSKLRIISTPDPEKNLSHAVQVEAQVLTFDTQNP